MQLTMWCQWISLGSGGESRKTTEYVVMWKDVNTEYLKHVNCDRFSIEIGCNDMKPHGADNNGQESTHFTKLACNQCKSHMSGRIQLKNFRNA
eukprot:308920-Amphidinium_carterae.2